MKTRITELLGIEVPVVQGAMARIADASLAGAVSEAGGLGIIACGGAPLSWVEGQVRIARSMTDKPIGANVMLMDPNAAELAKLLADLRVDVVTTGAGSPANFMQMWKDAGIKGGARGGLERACGAHGTPWRGRRGGRGHGGRRAHRRADHDGARPGRVRRRVHPRHRRRRHRRRARRGGRLRARCRGRAGGHPFPHGRGVHHRRRVQGARAGREGCRHHRHGPRQRASRALPQEQVRPHSAQARRRPCAERRRAGGHVRGVFAPSGGRRRGQRHDDGRPVGGRSCASARRPPRRSPG